MTDRDVDDLIAAARAVLATPSGNISGSKTAPGNRERLADRRAAYAALRAALEARATAVPDPDLDRLRRIARAALNTWVGRNWPSMAAMRRDGIGYGLVERNGKPDQAIRRFLDTFQPDFVVDLLDLLAASTVRPEDGLTEAAERVLDWADHHNPWNPADDFAALYAATGRRRPEGEEPVGPRYYRLGRS